MPGQRNIQIRCQVVWHGLWQGHTSLYFTLLSVLEAQCYLQAQLDDKKFVFGTAVYRPKDLEAEESSAHVGEADAARPNSTELAKANNESQAKTV